MNDRTGIGYGIYCPARGTFLGKLGSWYSDIRLAQLYAEPRAARLAMSRLEHGWPVAVVELHVRCPGTSLADATALVGTDEIAKVAVKAPEEPTVAAGLQAKDKKRPA